MISLELSRGRSVISVSAAGRLVEGVFESDSSGVAKFFISLVSTLRKSEWKNVRIIL